MIFISIEKGVLNREKNKKQNRQDIFFYLSINIIVLFSVLEDDKK